MDLFIFVNGKLQPSIHALMTEPFKGVWERDLSENHEEARKIFEYVELLLSPKKSNIYFAIDENIRPSRVKKVVWGDNPPTNTMEIMKCISAYKEALITSSLSYSLLTSGIKAAKDLELFLNTLPIHERTRSGGLVIKPRDITSALEELPETAKALELARTTVHQELNETSKTRNQREIGQYER